MKRNFNNSGFALVETLIVAVSVVTLFGLLYKIVYPLSGSMKASERYEDLDSKYVAFYIKSMIESNYFYEISNYSKNSVYKTEAYKCVMTYDYEVGDYICSTDSEGRTVYEASPVSQAEFYGSLGSSQTDRYSYKNGICEQLTDDSSSNIKNNRYFCNQYMHSARVTRMFVTDYNTTTFKSVIKNGSYSRSLKEYAKYMPYHTSAVNANDRKLLVVEIQHDSYTSRADYYYTYASIELCPLNVNSPFC